MSRAVSGRSAAWLAHLPWAQGVGGSNPLAPINMTTHGFESTWLPGQQEHGAGREAHFDILRGDLHRGPMWTEHGREAGDLVRSPWQVLPPGNYTALLQLWHHGTLNQEVGILLAETDGGRTLAELPIVTRSHHFGDWQRELISFQLGGKDRVRIRLRYNGHVSIWTGSLHLTRSGARPIHIIGHNRNTRAAIDRSLALGANSIEGDFSYRHGNLMVAETPPFPGWMETSAPAEWLAHLQSRRASWAFIYFDCKLAGVPDNDFYRFGQELCALIRAAGISPAACLFSVGDGRGLNLLRAVKDSGFAESASGMDGLNDGNPEHATPASWPQAASEYQLQCIGLGRAAIEVTKPLAHWLPSLQATVAARDSGNGWPKKVIFWTLEEKDGMRKVLDMGADAVIAEREDRLCEVISEEPYRHFCRRADPTEWTPFQAYGIDD